MATRKGGRPPKEKGGNLTVRQFAVLRLIVRRKGKATTTDVRELLTGMGVEVNSMQLLSSMKQMAGNGWLVATLMESEGGFSPRKNSWSITKAGRAVYDTAVAMLSADKAR